MESGNREFLDFIKKSTCPFTTVKAVEEELKKMDFKELQPEQEWQIEMGNCYYVRVFDTSVVAFSIGEKFGYHDRIHIAAAHTDQPCFVVKPNAVMTAGKYYQMNVESYGGAILNTWLDRPLGVAGCVVSRGKDAYSPVVSVVDSRKAVMAIPNLAIHFNREVNKGVELNRQKDMIPLAGILGEEENEQEIWLRYLEKLSGIPKEDILDYQMFLYNMEEGVISGLEEEFLMAPRIDNLASVFACMKGITGERNEHHLNIAVMFDHEEVGSRTKQGAASDMLYRILCRVFDSLGRSRENLEARISEGMFLSMDGAHAKHPNQGDKHDPTNPVYLNDGVIIKKAASQSYATDAVASAIVKGLCQENNIPHREFVNRSDITGGSTLGAIASTRLPMRMADVGIPMLAMHSAMEMTGTKDLEALKRLVCAFFQS